MSQVFNAEEVLEIATQIERNGALYYRRAAQLIDDPEAREMLLELAAMEEAHEITFENMRGNPELLSEVLGDPEGSAAAYLRAIAAGEVFSPSDNPVDALDEGVSIEDVLRQAIRAELQSIAFYDGLREAMPPALGRRKVEAIIEEERGHVVLLTRKLTRLAG